ncbi:4-hydroxy-3-methylbut-2-enyl diphosphate reductase [bacterium]|nr:4-hydroxy-3-methylbut-2-enyl diphosphate reductase [bacterium]
MSISIIFGISFFDSIMKVKVAKSAGFCVGVKRAVELVLRIADEHRNRRIFTYGPLIHNPQTIEMLTEKGITLLEPENRGNEGDIVVIRSHGVSPDVIGRLKHDGYSIFDATCPKVAFVHKLAKKYSSDGYAIIIIGDKNHSEVIGIEGEVLGDAAVVNSPEQVKKLPDWEKVAVVVQTTMDRQTFENVIEAIKNKFDEVVINNTLCSETAYRQDEIVELAKESGAFVVIGGKNSANTKRLYQLASQTGLPTFWVETVDELNQDDFEQIEQVAVVAGASTPHWIIDRVVEKLESMNRNFLPPWRWQWMKYLAYVILRSNFWASFAAGCFAAVIAAQLNIRFPVLNGLTIIFILFSVLNVYEYKEWQGLALMDPSKVRFVRNSRKILNPLSIISFATALIMSFSLNKFLGATAIAIIILTFAYWKIPILETIFPAFIKDSAILGLWIVLIWAYGCNWNLNLLIPLTMFGVLRGLTMGLKELETDRILQRKSITSALGEKTSVFLGLVPLFVCIFTLIISKSASNFIGIILGSVSMWFLAILVGFRIIRKGSYVEFLADSIVLIFSIVQWFKVFS